MSLRNNSERLGPHSHSDSEVPIPAQNDLSFVLPTMFVDLPSKGEFYPETHPLCGETSLEIRMMTAKDEDLLTNQDLIKKKVVLDRLVQSLLIDKSIRVDSLLIGDKNAILFAARVAGYGSDYTVEINCPSCGTKEKKTYDLEECLKQKEVDRTLVEPLGNGLFRVELPYSSVDCVFRLLTSKNEKTLLKKIDHSSKRKDNTISTDILKEMIVSLNGVQDKAEINNFINNMLMADSRFLKNLYDNVSPDVNIKGEFECLECGHFEVVEVPLTVEFFWPK